MLAATLFAVVIVPAVIFITPTNSIIGKVLITGETAQGVSSNDTFPTDYPSLSVEIAQYGENHPILSDLKGRVDDFVTPINLIDVVEYRGFALFDIQDGNGCIQLVVYRWDGASWRYVETTSFCPPG